MNAKTGKSGTIDKDTGEVISHENIYSAWAVYCTRNVDASNDSKGHYGLFASFNSGAKAFAERAKGLGLGLYQQTQCNEGVVSVQTVITHTSGGQLECGWVSIPVAGKLPANYASSLSWAKRLSLFIGCFLQSEDPDEEGKPVEKATGGLTPPFAPITKAPPKAPLRSVNDLRQPENQIPETKPVSVSEHFAKANSLAEVKEIKAIYVQKFGNDTEKLGKLDELAGARILEIQALLGNQA